MSTAQEIRDQLAPLADYIDLGELLRLADRVELIERALSVTIRSLEEAKADSLRMAQMRFSAAMTGQVIWLDSERNKRRHSERAL